MSVTVTWRTLDDWAEHAETFRGFTAREQAERHAWELGLSSNTLHIRIERPDAAPVEVARFDAADCTGGADRMSDEDDYGAINDPPDPDDDRGELARIGDQLQAEDDLHDAGGCDPKSCPVCAWVPEPGEVWPAPWPFNPSDCGGVWDGFEVSSDADPGL